MVALNGRYDGKVIVLDTPLDLPVNSRVRINVEPIELSQSAPRRADVSKLMGLGLQSPPHPHPRFPSEDALWDKTLENKNLPE